MPCSPIVGHNKARIDSEDSKASVDPELRPLSHESGSS